MHEFVIIRSLISISELIQEFRLLKEKQTEQSKSCIPTLIFATFHFFWSYCSNTQEVLISVLKNIYSTLKSLKASIFK